MYLCVFCSNSVFYFKCFALYHQFYLSAADLDRYNAAADAEARDAVLIAVAKHLPVQCRTSTGCKLQLLSFVDCIHFRYAVKLFCFGLLVEKAVYVLSILFAAKH